MEEGEVERLQAKFHLNVFIVSASGGQNNNFLPILTFWGLLYRSAFTDEGQISCARVDARSIRQAYLSSSGIEKTNFTILLNSAFCGVTSWQRSENIEHECTTTNLPLPNGIKIVSALQRLHGEIVRRISAVQKRDEQIYRQTKTQRFWPPRRRVISERHQTLHGDRGPCVRSVQSADHKRMHQLLHDLAVDVLADLAETAQLEEAAAGGDTSKCSRNVNSASV